MNFVLMSDMVLSSFSQPNLDNIDSDEENEIAADAFDELMDTEQFNEMEENSTEE